MHGRGNKEGSYGPVMAVGPAQVGALGSIEADLGREILVASKRQYRNKAVATPATIVIEGRSLD